MKMFARADEMAAITENAQGSVRIGRLHNHIEPIVSSASRLGWTSSRHHCRRSVGRAIPGP